jgi:hypothetical protein
MATIGEAVGEYLRTVHRPRFGLTQDDIARAARELGFNWVQSSVAQLETGRRRLSAEELLATPLILARSVGDPDPSRTADAQRGFSLLNIVDGLPESSVIELSPALVLSNAHMKRLLRGELQGDAIHVIPTRMAAEERAAATLGVTVATLNRRSRSRWGWTFLEEREYRMSMKSHPSASAAARKATLGQVTRRLVEELRTKKRSG